MVDRNGMTSGSVGRNTRSLLQKAGAANLGAIAVGAVIESAIMWWNTNLVVFAVLTTLLLGAGIEVWVALRPTAGGRQP